MEDLFITCFICRYQMFVNENKPAPTVLGDDNKQFLINCFSLTGSIPDSIHLCLSCSNQFIKAKLSKPSSQQNYLNQSISSPESSPPLSPNSNSQNYLNSSTSTLNNINTTSSSPSNSKPPTGSNINNISPSSTTTTSQLNNSVINTPVTTKNDDYIRAISLEYLQTLKATDLTLILSRVGASKKGTKIKLIERLLRHIFTFSDSRPRAELLDVTSMSTNDIILYLQRYQIHKLPQERSELIPMLVFYHSLFGPEPVYHPASNSFNNPITFNGLRRYHSPYSPSTPRSPSPREHYVSEYGGAVHHHHNLPPNIHHSPYLMSSQQQQANGPSSSPRKHYKFTNIHYNSGVGGDIHSGIVGDINNFGGVNMTNSGKTNLSKSTSHIYPSSLPSSPLYYNSGSSIYTPTISSPILLSYSHGTPSPIMPSAGSYHVPNSPISSPPSSSTIPNYNTTSNISSLNINNNTNSPQPNQQPQSNTISNRYSYPPQTIQNNANSYPIYYQSPSSTSSSSSTSSTSPLLLNNNNNVQQQTTQNCIITQKSVLSSPSIVYTNNTGYHQQIQTPTQLGSTERRNDSPPLPSVPLQFSNSFEYSVPQVEGGQSNYNYGYLNQNKTLIQSPSSSQEKTHSQNFEQATPDIASNPLIPQCTIIASSPSPAQNFDHLVTSGLMLDIQTNLIPCPPQIAQHQYHQSNHNQINTTDQYISENFLNMDINNNQINLQTMSDNTVVANSNHSSFDYFKNSSNQESTDYNYIQN